MIPCVKCGENNPIGHVFCRKCGNKLNLQALDSATVTRATKPSFLKRYRTELIGLPVVLGVIALLFSLWPDSSRIGDAGTLIGARRVEGLLASYAELKPGQPLGPEPFLRDKDINGYLEYVKLGALRVLSASAAIEDGRIRVRVVQAVGSVDLLDYRLTPRYSTDWILAPSNGRLVVVGGRAGHLPMVGPGKAILAARLRRLFRSQPDWAVLGHVKDIQLAGGGVGLVVEK